MNIYAEIKEERARQIGKGYTAEYDDTHTEGELAEIAGLVIMARRHDEYASCNGRDIAWELLENHPDRRGQLLIGVALAVAEIERLDRANQPESSQEGCGDGECYFPACKADGCEGPSKEKA